MVRWLGAEPALALYMFGAFLKTPVFQTILYEKACLQRYDRNFTLCTDVDAIYKDEKLQSDANRLYLLSSLVLLVPSIPTSLLLGYLTDGWSIRLPLLVPYVGLALGHVNYIIQGQNMDARPEWLFLSDAVFGICGGFTAIIGTTFAYGMKTTSRRWRSIRTAALEGAIGVGGTAGFALAGPARKLLGYAMFFALLLVLSLMAIVFNLIFTRRNEDDEGEEQEDREERQAIGGGAAERPSLCQSIVQSATAVLTSTRRHANLLRLLLLALAVELIIFSGITDIDYSFLRYRLGWDDLYYGWLSGASYATSSIAILTLYPYLRKRRKWSDGQLGVLGIGAKMCSLVAFAFISSTAYAFAISPLTALNRFVSTAFRSAAAQLVGYHEQGQLFSLVALSEGVTSILASLLYNGLYPWTLNFFAGTLYIASAVLLVFPLLSLWYTSRRMEIDGETATGTSSAEALPPPSAELSEG